MPPKKSRKANVKETLVVSDPLKFQNPNVQKYFLKLQGKTFIQEKGFQPLMILCKEIWSIVQYHRWERFCLIPKENVVISIVQEFYVALRDEETKRPHSVRWEMVTESGLIIQVFARENNIKVSNYLPKIIDPDHSIANPTSREVKMRKEAKMNRRRPQSKTFKREDDDYDETFQSQYFTPRGLVIRIPTRHAHSSGGDSSRGHISGKGNAPMERGQSHHFDNSDN
ncbi:hypothetical protein Gotri_014445 [Gossypium trilobum]|uniref:Uncharacterized protein n=1 Tax=Gossypium trilobum TaxID=34281 RepID=A0A7J9DWT0_9ROSI|nr:hypothetical protein [Gossypium trilobum]